MSSPEVRDEHIALAAKVRVAAEMKLKGTLRFNPRSGRLELAYVDKPTPAQQLAIAIAGDRDCDEIDSAFRTAQWTLSRRASEYARAEQIACKALADDRAKVARLARKVAADEMQARNAFADLAALGISNLKLEPSTRRAMRQRFAI